jgi:glycerol-3-phosphate acyltransferase PlsY
MTFLVILGCFILLMIFTKIVSVSSIVCSILFPLIEVFIFHETRPPLVVLAVTVAIFIPYTHRENIKRLMAGTEKKFDFGRNKIVKH